MHQPDYRDPVSRVFRAPWTYLHAIKDYTDMAWHLEHNPGASAVVNFSPVLIDQLCDIGARMKRCVPRGEPVGEPLLDALAQPVLAEDEDQRRVLAAACLRANERHLIERFPSYKRLAELARTALASADGFQYLDDRFLFDLLVWYHLAWMGESVRRTDDRVARLIGKKRNYSWADRRDLVAVITELLDNLPGRYAALADTARVELSVSPWAHPILPLLLDFGAARETVADSSLPASPDYPGGEARARWHLVEAVRAFRAMFGREPAGCWPSEGAVCTRSLKLIEEAGFRWAASGQHVLRHSLGKPHPVSDELHRIYRLADNRLSLFFRDDGLSDLIGFTYKDWHGDDAAADLVKHLERIAAEEARPGRVVAIVLDGENAWEHYPNNGWYFLTALYELLARHPFLELTTFGHCADDPGREGDHLEKLVAGSWVYGDLSTWIGHADKNHAWDMLCTAKRLADGRSESLDDPAVIRQLAVCEGSDWFWWPGEYNPALAVAQFERLYRLQLAGLYRLLDSAPPEDLTHPFSFGGGHPEAGGTMRPSV
ncbi:MAG: glycoside hydrolase family 57 protein [Gammaproteobacteria bacterium]|jgi:alpha-amylase/alpha-mannosidase (GH57 family)